MKNKILVVDDAAFENDDQRYIDQEWIQCCRRGRKWEKAVEKYKELKLIWL